MNAQLSPAHRPRLLSGVRTHHDRVRDRWVLLAPERALELDAIALNILEEIDGTRTLEEVVDALAAKFDAPRERIDEDVRMFLASLAERRLMEFVP